MTEVDCPLCGSNDSQVVIEENGYQGRKCTSCGLIYVSPRPSLDKIHDLYGHDEASVTAESHITSAFPKRLYARHHLKLIQRYLKNGKLLEVGAGAGYFLDEARKRGFNCHGIEFNPILAKYIRDHLLIDCEQKTLRESSYMADTFDLVYHCDVASHFYNPLDEFSLMSRIIRQGGYMIFETGNIGDIEANYFRYFDKFQYPDHLFFFGENNIEYLLEKTGFELIRLYRYSLMPQFALGWITYNLKRFIRGTSVISGKNIESNNESTIKARDNYGRSFRQALKRFRISVMEYIYFLLRYRLGRLLVRPGQPQTHIVIAKKIPD